MWSPVEKTALAEAEIEYEDIVSTQIDVAFEIVESNDTWAGRRLRARVDDHALDDPSQPGDRIQSGRRIRPRPPGAWCRGRGISATIKRTFLVAASLVDALVNRRTAELTRRFNLARCDGKAEVLRQFKGSELAGAIARHPMHDLGGFFARPRPFLPGNFVTTDQGTGLVHMAPDHGEDDFELCRANGIDPVFAVDAGGFYRPDWLWLGGQGASSTPSSMRLTGRSARTSRRGRSARGKRRLPAQLPAFMALEGQGHLSLHAAVVHRDGEAVAASLGGDSGRAALGQ